MAVLVDAKISVKIDALVEQIEDYHYIFITICNFNRLLVVSFQFLVLDQYQ